MNEREWRQAALLLVGFQNDFFREDGALRTAFEDPGALDRALERTLDVVRAAQHTSVAMIAVPITFTETYDELVGAVGILAAIRDHQAFRANSPGSEMVQELLEFGPRIQTVPGRRGFDAFAGTALDAVLSDRGVRHLLLTGALSSVCVDATARSAVERGYRVSVIRDGVVGRTAFEHEFQCRNVFPLYADVLDSADVLRSVGRPAQAS